MAKQAYAQGQHEQAVRLCDQLISRLGLRDDLLNIKALSLLALGRVEAAEVSMRKALKLNSRAAGMHLNAAGIYKSLSQNKQVKRHALEAVRLAPREAVVLYQSALFCRYCGDYSQALRIIDRCLQIQPEFSRAWQLKGSALTDLGKTEAAQTAMEQAVELDPGNVRALSTLINLRGDRLCDTKTVALLEQIRSTAASLADRASAAFSLANLYRNDRQYDVAFAHFLEANALVASNKPFDINSWEEKTRRTAEASGMPGILEPLKAGSGANLVFIVGMPRSGTSLCEQVLSANSHVLTCGELSTIENIEGSLARQGFNPYQSNPDRSQFERAASLYLSALPKNHGSFQLVTDKAPMNFEYIGLIHLLFPQARFLYCIRHPLDTILSCFMQDFHAGLVFASNLEWITRVYIAHAQLMKHWIKLLPGLIHTVKYEQYIEHQEAETHGMAEFLELDFQAAMLTPHLQERAVVTASNLQVRQAVYGSSIGRWKNYQTQLTGVIDMLQKAGLLDEELNSTI